MILDPKACQNADRTVFSRRSFRALIDLPVKLTMPTQDNVPATMADISTGGCRVRSMYQVANGRFLTVDIPGFASYSGWVAWRNGSEFGIDLSNSIPDDVVQYFLTVAQKRAEIDVAWFKALISKTKPMHLSNHAKPSFS